MKDFPSAVIFDLDYTLWPCWCDTHIQVPLKRLSATSVVDALGFQLSIYQDVSSIFKMLKRNNIPIIGASRTARPDIALNLLTIFEVDNVPLSEYFDSLQWGQGSKISHIRKAVSELNLKKELEGGRIILFDDELRNKDVEKIHCRFCHVPDSESGLTKALFERAMSECSNRGKKTI